MNEGSGNKIFDLSHRRKIGTLSNVDWSLSPFGFALLSNAITDYTDLGACAVLDFATEATIISKFMFTSATSQSDIFMIGTRASSQPLNLYFNISAANHFAALVTDNAGHTSGVKLSSFVPVINTWYQIALVFKGDSTIRLFVNGIEDIGASFPASVPTVSDIKSGSVYTIGGDSAHTSYGARALFDHVHLYNRAFSPSEISRIYSEPFLMFDGPSLEKFLFSPIEGIWLAAALSSQASISAKIGLSLALNSSSQSVSTIVALLQAIRGLKTSFYSNASIVANLSTVEEILLQSSLLTQASITAGIKIDRGLQAALPSSSSIVALLKAVRGIKSSLSSVSTIVANLSKVEELLLSALLTSSSSVSASLTVTGIKWLVLTLATSSFIFARLTVPTAEKFLYEKWDQYAKLHPQKSSTGRVYTLDAYLMCRKVNMRNLKLGLPMQEEPPDL